MRYSLRSPIVFLASLLLNGVYAGSGATVHACVYIATAPPLGQTYVVDFQAGGSSDHCMNDRGQSTSVTVTTKGLTCASLGYVELKNSSTGGDFCGTDKSWWATSYTIKATGQSGSTNSRWEQGGKITLRDPSPGTAVCGSEALCTSSERSWDSTGELWIIHRPGFTGISIPEITDCYKSPTLIQQNPDL